MAEREFKQGYGPEALQTSLSGYKQFEKRTDSEWHWKFKLQLADFHLWKGQAVEARPFLSAPPPSRFAALALRYRMLRGYLSYWNKNYSEALELLHLAIGGAEARHEYQLTAEAELLLGAVLSRGADLAAAEAEFRQALKVASDHGLAYERIEAYNNLGNISFARGRYGPAIEYYTHASELAADAGALVAQALAAGNSAEAYFELGDLERARQALEDVIPVMRRADLPVYLGDLYLELGSVWLATDPAKAESYFRLSLDLIHNDPASPQFPTDANQLAEALLLKGSLDQAGLYNARAARAVGASSAPDLAAITLTEARLAERRHDLSKAALAYQKVLNLSAETPSARWQAYAGLAAIDGQTGNLKAAGRNYENALAVIAANRADQLKNDYKLTFLSQLIRFYQSYVTLLMKQGETSRALEIADSSRAGVLAESLSGQSTATRSHLIAYIQKAAQASNCVFLFYWLAPDGSYLWVITASGSKVVSLPGQAEITRDVESYRDLIEQQKRDPLSISNPLGSRLYGMLLAPAAQWLLPASRVVIVPDGPLHSLNFETLLVDAPAPHYLLADLTISVAPSLSVLEMSRPPRSAQRSIALMGDPITAGTGYEPLPQSAAEIGMVERHFNSRDTFPLTRRKAIPEAYKASQPARFSNVHFATHVDANEQSPLDSAIILSPGANGFRLYAREVAETPITADLVTISGCRGAGARALTGEGLVGFAWAFFHAGARNVVTSLWDVNDNSTPTLMDRFYQGVEDGKSYAAALREAKLTMLRVDHKAPYYWAPFQLYSRTLEKPPR